MYVPSHSERTELFLSDRWGGIRIFLHTGTSIVLFPHIADTFTHIFRITILLFYLRCFMAKQSLFVRGLLLVFLLFLGFVVYTVFFSSKQERRMGGVDLAPVRISEAAVQDVPYFLNGLGTVLASSDVLVKSRVAGQLVKIHFTEGQHVKEGDLLAEIDPRPFQATLNEAKGRLAADEAQLANARRDLARYASLVRGDYVERQKYDTQAALVQQLSGSVASERAAVENARLQLEYSRITAPSSGIVGLKKVDSGNQITANDATGIVRITEVSPCDVLFTLPETAVPRVLKALSAGGAGKLPVQAWDREQKMILGTGTLLSIDNEIDVSTGTVRLKARFANEDRALYPNQFVNARIRVDVLRNAVTVPSAAIQVGAKGRYVFVYTEGDAKKTADEREEKGRRLDTAGSPLKERPQGADRPLNGGKDGGTAARTGTVSMRMVTVGVETANLVVVDEGLSAHEWVIVDGLDRLKEGVSVRVAATFATPKAEPLE